MEGRSGTIIISILMFIVGIIFVFAGIWGLWTSFTIPEGALIRPVAIMILIVGFAIFIIYIRKLLRISRQSELSF